LTRKVAIPVIAASLAAVLWLATRGAEHMPQAPAGTAPSEQSQALRDDRMKNSLQSPPTMHTAVEPGPYRGPSDVREATEPSERVKVLPKSSDQGPVTKEPTTRAELERFLYHHFSPIRADKNLPAVSFIFEEEMRDPTWATPLEQQVTDVVAGMGGVAVLKGECRTSLCIYEVKTRDGFVPQAFAPELRSRKPDVFLAWTYDGSHAKYYIFRLTIPAPYVPPLRQLLLP
jgi:hypothetical protein